MADDLNRKLAEWARFKSATQEEYSPGSIPQPDMEKRGWGFKYPDGRIKWYLPNFPFSLDAIFKWLVPPIEGKGLTLSYVSFQQASGRYYAEWKIYGENDQVKCGELLAKAWQEGTDLAEITALALCKAIEQLIDKEV